ncbi:dehydrogenase [Sphingomonas sp. NFR15]|uniref:GHMP family kinase ATP-binding protein n=1 Tax=Sphingomonas sp. NFR15 TaxID=1566282 RepID=UPI000888A7E9|nr:dehydrogenase [Sphingomonas sp. NFR15]SDA36898.1 D-glycero-alpha-D-manno-heptose-7-phosphate kinase [Sphingomonas sp. NFR15]
MIIRARAPLRLGLAGGGTDVSPYCDEHGGYVLNATIDRYAYASLKMLDEPVLRFTAQDQGQTETLPLTDLVPLEGALKLHKAVYNEIVRIYNEGRPLAVDLTSFCDAPTGSGLGSSSTVVVVLIRAFAELLNLPLDDYATAHLAYKIERVDCGLQGGRQDQYAATFGGFNFIEFYADDRVVVNPLRIRSSTLWELESSLLLFYTGISRESARIIADQSKNLTQGVTKTVDAMHALKAEAVRMKECILRGDFENLVETMRAGWASKKNLASSISNPHLDEVFEAALDAGASAGKISGAGGGGFMMFFVPPERRMSVIDALGRYPGQVSNCHFTEQGSESWRAQA